MKWYIAIDENDIVVKNWGGQAELTSAQVEQILGYNPKEIIEVKTAKAVRTGFPLSCYNKNWKVKTPAELAAEGLDEQGQPLPTAEEKAAEAEQEARISLFMKKKSKLHRWIEFNKNYVNQVLEPIAKDIANMAVNNAVPVITDVQARAIAYNKAHRESLGMIKAKNSSRIDYAAKQVEKFNLELAELTK